MNRQLFLIFKHIRSQDCITAEEIAVRENLSSKTVRLRVRELAEEMEGKGACIETKRGQGYRLIITDSAKYELWRSKIAESMDSKVPESKEERQEYILQALFECKDYIKRQELADLLHISEKSISQDLKQIEHFLGQYNLQIEKTPFYGMRIKGSEYEKRQCLADFILKNHIQTQMLYKNQEKRKKLGKIIQTTLEEYNVQIPEMSFACLAVYLEVLIHRTKQGFLIGNGLNVNSDENTIEMQIAHCLIQKLQAEMGVVKLNTFEEQYICMLLSSSRIAGKYHRGNIEIVPQLDSLVKAMFQSVKERFGLDFSGNFDLWVLMNHHMEYLDTRMKYYIPLKNPILDKLKEQYMFAYAIAEQAAIPVSHFYKRKIPEDEIGYFALLFQVALEEKNKDMQIRNILLVCVTGKISSKFLETRLRQEFGSSLRNIISCDVQDLDKMDFKNIEYVLTTIPLTKSLPLPVIRIKEFLDNAELDNLRLEMDEQRIGFIGQYYKRELFFCGIRGNSREEVLKEICRKLATIQELPTDFYEQVITREQFGSTDYKRLIAIPHPYQWQLKENLVCVTVLDKPLLWEKNEVQLVVLAALANTASTETQRFYDITMNTLMNEKAIKKVIEEKTWASWIRALTENA